MTEKPLTKKTVAVLDSRMAYHERGGGPPVLLLHGNPTSSYLWRDVIPELEGRGRPIAPDLTSAVRDSCRSWKNQSEVAVSGSHFIHEDSGPAIGQAVAKWMKANAL